MPDETPSRPLARATAGQLRRAGFAVVPDETPDSASVGGTIAFEVLVHQDDEVAGAEHAEAVERGDAFPGG